MADTGSDADVLKRQVLYDYDNPVFSFDNAMKDVGINPYAANPFVSKLKQAAPSFSASYLIGQATDSTDRNVNLGSVTSGKNSFGDYLRGHLKSGTLFDRSAERFGDINKAVGKVRDYRKNLGNPNQVASQFNPYLAALSDRLGMNNGAGTTDFMQALVSPFMNRGMAQAYGTGLNAQLGGSIRRLGDDGLFTNNDIWTYLLGT